MILTKQKKIEDSISLNIGVNNFVLDIAQNENFWIDWAVSFQQMCIDKLGLEIERGPGTSVGIIQTTVGPSRYQYDCDWNNTDGRLEAFNSQEKGFTFWEDIPVWSTFTNNSGIDIINKRFDFILWFTAPSLDDRNNNEGSRLGLRFKYPLTHEMGYKVSATLPKAPVIMPWKSNDAEKNKYLLDQQDREGSTRTGTASVVFTDFFRFRTLNYYEPYRDNGSSYASTLTNSNNQTKVFDSGDTRYNWKKYADNTRLIENNEDESRISYQNLGGNYTNFTTNGVFKDFKYFQVLASNNFDTIDLRVKNSNDDILFDILYGNLITEQYQVNGQLKEITNSFVSVVTNGGLDYTNYFSDFIITDFGVVGQPSKQVNRPVTLDTSNQRMYWGISRLLLDGTYLHCKDLYQVFSFSDLMANSVYEIKTFVDNNNEEHNFLMFNHGNTKDVTSAKKAIALAIPIN